MSWLWVSSSHVVAVESLLLDIDLGSDESPPPPHQGVMLLANSYDLPTRGLGKGNREEEGGWAGLEEDKGEGGCSWDRK